MLVDHADPSRNMFAEKVERTMMTTNLRHNVRYPVAVQSHVMVPLCSALAVPVLSCLFDVMTLRSAHISIMYKKKMAIEEIRATFYAGVGI